MRTIFGALGTVVLAGCSLVGIRSGYEQPRYEVVDHAEISALIEEHLSGSQNRRLLIGSLLNVDQWMRQTFA